MGRRYVPAKLHAEISEYASLLRALHTSSALDVTARLTGPPRLPPTGPTGAGDHDEGHAQTGDDVRVAGSSSSQGSPTATGKKKAAVQKQPSIDTRWPLLPEDVPAPAWTLEDEVRVLATRVLHSDQTGRDYNDVENESHDDDDSVDSILPFLTQACTDHLTHILELISMHVPISEKSMQGRITPITWESVLDIVSVRGACDVRSIENAQRRLEAIYGPAEKRVVLNVDFREVDRQKFESVCPPEEMDFLTFPPQPETVDDE